MSILNTIKGARDGETFIIAEVSANHKQDKEIAKAIIKGAADAGATAVKLQTYTPDTITLECENEYFRIEQDTIWDGRTLYDLYKEAYTPWEWHKELIEYANSLGIICFSSPFDISAVDFLEELNVPCYKIASFEINDIPLIEYVASKGKPIIISTGVATMAEIEEAISACKRMNNDQIILLKCTSAYPTPLEEVNLLTIPNMRETFGFEVGLSDHTLGGAVAIGAVALGARVIEKHLTLRRSDGGVDATFSMEPEEFKLMVENIRIVEKALGEVSYDLTEKQINSTKFKRSLFISEDIKKGESISYSNVRSIRPNDGLHTRYLQEVIGKKVRMDIAKGTPLKWEHLE